MNDLRVIQTGERYGAARITGPNHHFLGLWFGNPATSRDDAVTSDVRAGVARANADLGADLVVSEIHTADGDRYQAGVYEQLAYAIAAYRARQG